MEFANGVQDPDKKYGMCVRLRWNGIMSMEGTESKAPKSDTPMWRIEGLASNRRHHRTANSELSGVFDGPGFRHSDKKLFWIAQLFWDALFVLCRQRLSHPHLPIVPQASLSLNKESLTLHPRCPAPAPYSAYSPPRRLYLPLAFRRRSST